MKAWQAALLGLAVGLVLGSGITLWRVWKAYDAEVKAWEEQRKEFLEQRETDQQQIEQWKAAAMMEELVRRANNAESQARADSIKVLLARKKPAERPPLPTTELMPVAEVKVIVDGLVEQIAIRDSIDELRVAQHSSDSADIASYQRQLTAMANVSVALQVRLADAEALIKKAPVRKPEKKLFGLIPPPELQVTAGIQGGTGICGTENGTKPCTYAGVGGTVGGGWKINLRGS